MIPGTGGPFGPLELLPSIAIETVNGRSIHVQTIQVSYVHADDTQNLAMSVAMIRSDRDTADSGERDSMVRISPLTAT